MFKFILEGGDKSTFVKINDLIGVIIWPSLLLIFFYIYRKSISKLLLVFVKKFEISSKVSLGTFTLEIERTARIYGNDDLGLIIQNLSEKGVRKLMTFGYSSHSFLTRGTISEPGTHIKHTVLSLPDDYGVYLELEKNGLVVFIEPLKGFLDFFMKLKPSEKIGYKQNGEENIPTVYNERQNLTDTPVITFTLSTEHLNKIDFHRLDDMGARLSPLGQKALEIIVRVVASQISKE